VTLPDKRIIQSATYGTYEEPDVTDEEAQEIIEAIAQGRLITFVASEYQKHWSQGPECEVDLTYYRDPRSGEFRYAVETWLGARKWTYDFDSETAARERMAADRRMVKL
jgi:hypothetical protein